MRSASLLAIALCGACGGSSSSFDAAPPVVDMRHVDLTMPNLVTDGAWTYPSGANVVEMISDNGAIDNAPPDVGYVTITLCAPGTSTCQTLDHVTVDTGSVGMRIVYTSLNATMQAALPTFQMGGDPIAECYEYAEGFVYGGVRQADLAIGGEKAPNVSFQLIGDRHDTPMDCQNGASSDNAIASFRANGIIGVAPFAPDCGDDCTTTTNPSNPTYFDCASVGSCVATGVPIPMQVQNPVSLFPVDNNGIVIQMPGIDDNVGAINPHGTLTFGIGTQANNAITTEQVYVAQNFFGLARLESKVGTNQYDLMIFDSGTSAISLEIMGLQDCLTYVGYLCPQTTMAFTATLTDVNKKTGPFNFKIADAEKILQNNATAFDDLGVTGGGSFFIAGLPSFFGKKIFFAIEGSTTPNGMGPFYAL